LKALENDIFNLERFQIFESVQLAKDYFLANIPVIGLQYVDYIDLKNSKVKISIALAITSDQYATSLPSAPFGGFWCDTDISPKSLDAFLVLVEQSLKSRGIKSITIVQPPKIYESQSDLVNYFLFKSGWALHNILSHQFFCGAKKIKNFLQSESPRIRKKMKSNSLFSSYNYISNFDFLKKMKDWNTQKGYEFNINEDLLVRQVSSYPDRYFLIKLQQGDQIVGYALAVKLTSNSIYYFLSAFDSAMNLTGGGEFLLLELFLLAKDQKVDFIDLGSSNVREGPNYNLMFFKSRFSNEISSKMTWYKEFQNDSF
jgi:hypothetical protein